MYKTAKTRTAYNFRNTCHKCFNDIEFLLLGDCKSSAKCGLKINQLYRQVNNFSLNSSLRFETLTLIVVMAVDPVTNAKFITSYAWPKLSSPDHFSKTTKAKLCKSTWSWFDLYSVFSTSPDNVKFLNSCPVFFLLKPLLVAI
jgi:hypothetical protein